MIARFADRRVFLVSLWLSFAIACDKVPLLAPSQSRINLFSTSNIVPLNGSTSVTAVATEAPGTPVHNGTLLSFTTTLGSIEPSSASTHNGQVQVTFRAGNRSGTARITAFSGPASSTTTPGGGTAVPALEIRVGAAAAGRVLLFATPSSLPSIGGSTQLTAIVQDSDGNRLPGIPITFTTTQGVISPPGIITTDDNGEARVTLTSNREARVRAVVGGSGTTVIQSDELTIAVNAAPVVTLTAEPASAAVGQPVAFRVGVTSSVVPIVSGTIDFGDGTVRPASAGVFTNTYRAPGTYVATVRLTDANGETGSASVAVTIAPLVVTVSASPNPVPFSTGLTRLTATVTPSTVPILRFEWDFGDGRTGFGNPVDHIYPFRSVFIVTVTVVTVDGARVIGRTEVLVQ